MDMLSTTPTAVRPRYVPLTLAPGASQVEVKGVPTVAGGMPGYFLDIFDLRYSVIATIDLGLNPNITVDLPPEILKTIRDLQPVDPDIECQYVLSTQCVADYGDRDLILVSTGPLTVRIQDCGDCETPTDKHEWEVTTTDSSIPGRGRITPATYHAGTMYSKGSIVQGPDGKMYRSVCENPTSPPGGPTTVSDAKTDTEGAPTPGTTDSTPATTTDGGSGKGE